MKKIAFLCHDISSLGGVQKVVVTIANKLSEIYDVTIICCKKNQNIDAFVENYNNIKVYSGIQRNVVRRIIDHCLGLTKIGENEFCTIKEKVLYGEKIKNELISYINNNRFDYVVGVEGYWSLALAMISPNIVSKTYGWQHSSYESYFKKKNCYYWGQESLFKKNVSKLSKYIVLNDVYKKSIDSNWETNNCVTISNPLSITSKIKSDVSNKVILYAGRYSIETKGLDFLIESFEIFIKRKPDWELRLVGDGADKKTIQGWINEKGLSNKIIIKERANDMISEYLEASILALPSRWEGMPMVVLEAFEMGLPVCAFDIDAMNGLVENRKEGLIAKKYDVEEFANNLFALADNYEYRKELSENCIVKSINYNLENISKHWIELFDTN